MGSISRSANKDTHMEPRRTTEDLDQPVEWHNSEMRSIFHEICVEAFEQQLAGEGEPLLMAADPIVFYNKRYHNNPVVSLSWEFASDVLHSLDVLLDMKKFGIMRQLERCGPSVGANVREGQNGESLADFIHKNAIALKEADESEFFLSLCEAKNYPGAAKLRQDAYRLVRILNSIIAKSKLKQNRNK